MPIKKKQEGSLDFFTREVKKDTDYFIFLFYLTSITSLIIFFLWLKYYTSSYKYTLFEFWSL